MTSEPMYNRRSSERFRLQPMLTEIKVSRGSSVLDSHAYDISEGGLRIELDEAPRMGESMSLQIGLPGLSAPVGAEANVVRIYDEHDDPGPRRVALQFSSFTSGDDRDRLAHFFASADARRAA